MQEAGQQEQQPEQSRGRRGVDKPHCHQFCLWAQCTLRNTRHDREGEGARKGCKVVGQACYGFTSYSLDYGIYFFNLCTISLSSTGEWKRERGREQATGSRRPTTSRSLSLSRRNWLQLMMKWKQKWDRDGEGEWEYPEIGLVVRASVVWPSSGLNSEHKWINASLRIRNSFKELNWGESQAISCPNPFFTLLSPSLSPNFFFFQSIVQLRQTKS